MPLQLGKQDSLNCTLCIFCFFLCQQPEITEEFQEEAENSVSVSIPFKLTRNVLWVLKCRSLSQYSLDATEATEPSGCFSPSLQYSLLYHRLLCSPLHAEENLSFIVKVMLSHLSQSLLLNCCIPSPSPPSLPVHLHTHTLLTGIVHHLTYESITCITHVYN